MSRFYNQISIKVKEETAVGQNELIQFLSIKILDGDKQQFEEAFRRLTLKSQNIFFNLMAKKEKLAESIDCVPKDIKKIAINFGRISSQDAIGEMITSKFKEFTQLEEIDFDISEISYYTEAVAERIDTFVKMSPIAGGYSSYGQHDDYPVGSGIYRPNNIDVANRVIYDSVKFLESNKQVKKITIQFLGPLVNHSRIHREEIARSTLKDNKLYHMADYVDEEHLRDSYANEFKPLV